MSIQVLKPKFEIEECLEAVKECLEQGWTGMGFKPLNSKKPGKITPVINMHIILIPTL